MTGASAGTVSPTGSPVASPAGRVVRNAILKAAVQATRLLSLAFLVLAARLLGPEAFGKFTFAYALATLLGAVLDLGMHALLVREVARAPADTALHWTAAVTLKLLLLGPAALVFAFLPWLTGRPPDTTAAVWLLGAAIALQSFIEATVSVFTAYERIEFELGLRLGEKVVLFVVGVGGLWLGGGLRVVSGAFTLAALVSLGVAVALLHRRFAPLAWRWRPRAARGLAVALGPVAAAFVLGFAASRLVPLLVGLLAGDLAAGYLGAALRVLDVTMVVPIALVAAVYPLLARTPPSDAGFRRVVGQSVEVLLLLGLPLALALGHGAAWVTRAAYGRAYEATAPLLAVLGVSACLGFVNGFLGFVFLALDRPRRLLVLAVVTLAASVTITPVLVRLHGAAGGAWALVLIDVVVLGGALVGLVPLIGLPCGRGALKALTAAAAGAGLALALPPGSGWRPVVALAVYAGGVLALRPLPGVHWGRLLRGIVWPSGHA